MGKTTTIFCIFCALASLWGCRAEEPEIPRPEGGLVITRIAHVRKYLSGEIQSNSYRLTYSADGKLVSDGWYKYVHGDGKIIVTTIPESPKSNIQYSEVNLDAGRVSAIDVYDREGGNVMITKRAIYTYAEYLSAIVWGEANSEIFEWDPRGNMVRHNENISDSRSLLEIEYGNLPNDFNLDLAAFLTLGQYRSAAIGPGLLPVTGKRSATLPVRCVCSEGDRSEELVRYGYETDGYGVPVKVINLNPEKDSCSEVYFTITYEIIKNDTEI